MTKVSGSSDYLKHKKISRRIFAAFTFLFFLASHFNALPLYGAVVPNAAPESNLSPESLSSVHAPEESGEVAEVFQGRGKRSVILIQDAHAIPEAQQNIQKLIQYFEERHGVSLVLLEGASSKFDATFFQSFPDPEILGRVFKGYFESGELTGGVAASIFSSSPAHYQGLEDWALYEEGLEHYQRSMQKENEILPVLKLRKEQLREQKRKNYSDALFVLDQTVEAFYENEADIVSVLKAASAIQPPAESSGIHALWQQIQDSGLNNLDLHQEILKTAQDYEKYLAGTSHSHNRQQIAAFNQKLQEFKTSDISDQEFAVFLQEASSKASINLKFSPLVQGLVKQYQRFRDIKGSKFIKEFEDYIVEVKKSQLQTKEQLDLDEQTEKLRMVEKLVQLELDYNQWTELQKKQAEIYPLGFDLSSQFSFYKNAEQRDEVFLTRSKALMDENNKQTAILVTGGFHTQGLIRQLRDEDISYLLITPKMTAVPEETNYLRHMQGDFSWKEYFKAESGRIKISDAFARATRDLLLKETAQEKPLLVKSWRDQIIRNLAAEGQVAKAGEYTAYLDELTGEKKTAADPKITRAIEEWFRNTQNFISSLKRLEQQGIATPENILNLLPASALLTTEGAVVSGDAVRSTLLPAARVDVPAVSLETPKRSEARDEKEPKGIVPSFSDAVPLGTYPLYYVGYFSGLENYEKYLNEGSELYLKGGDSVRKIYEDAAEALGYPRETGVNRLFFDPANIPGDSVEQNAFTSVAFLVHNLALHAYFKERKIELPGEIMAYSGEDFGFLSAAVVSGSMSIRDAVLLAKEFPPCLRGCEMTEEAFRVVGIRSSRLPEIAEELVDNFSEGLEIHRYYSEGKDGQYNLYVSEKIYKAFINFLSQRFSDAQVMELRQPTQLLVNSRRVSDAKDKIDNFINEQHITFDAPAQPVIYNGEVLMTAADIARAIYSIIDAPQRSAQTLREIDGYSSDGLVEFGLGDSLSDLLKQNRIGIPYFQFNGNHSATFRISQTLYLMEAFKARVMELQKPNFTDLTEDDIQLLRWVFEQSMTDPAMKEFLFANISHLLSIEMETTNRMRYPAYDRFLQIAQNTYLAHHVLNMKHISPKVLVLDSIFKTRLKNNFQGAAEKIDVELLILTEDDEELTVSTMDYKYPELITFMFGRLPLNFVQLTRKIREIMKHQGMGELFRRIASESGLDIDYFIDARMPADETRLTTALIAYQFVLFKLMEIYRPAILGQNFHYVSGQDRVGRLTAMATSGAITIGEAIKLNMALESNAAEIALPPVKEAAIRVMDISNNTPLKTAEELQAFIEREKKKRFPTGASYESPLKYRSWLVSFDVTGTTIPSELNDAVEVVQVGGLEDIWRQNTNPQLDMLSNLSLMRFTDQNGKVFRFAEGRGTTTANVYPYVNAGERIVGFGRGGAESLVIFLKPARGDDVFVRKVLSERLITARWDRGGTGVMAAPFDKAELQARWLQRLPEAVRPYFPEVFTIDRRDLEIPPSHPDFQKYDGVYKELQYDMSYLEGTEVSKFIATHQPPPAVVAQIYKAIFKILHEKVHSERRRVPARPSLESSYFTKIEKRLALAQKTAPHTFSDNLIGTPTIIIDGRQMDNIKTLLEKFRGHPEYLDLLEPTEHTLAVGDTNTENIMITNPGPILEAIRRGDVNFTPEEIGIKFFDPRAIGYHENGKDTGSDDPMYDNKPWHNSIARYDEMHGDYFKLTAIVHDQMTPQLSVDFTPGNPYQKSYTGIRSHFAPVMTDVLDLDNPNSEANQKDPYWLIRFAFIMGTHFTAMPPFHFKTDTDGRMIDGYENQARPVAIYAEGIKWLNLALDMLEGRVTNYLGIPIPPLPYAPPAEAPARSESRLAGPQDMSNESRVFFSPWSRLARGTGLGPHTLDYDAKTAAQLRSVFDALGEVVPADHSYNNFSRLLVDLILDVTSGQKLSRQNLVARTAAILAQLDLEKGAYANVTAAAILMDAYAKLELPPDLLVNAKRDLLQESLDKIGTIPFKNDGIYGYYEQVTAYTSLFVSAGQLGLKDRLVSGETNYIQKALSQLETIPSPWNRGRGASMLFAALKILGYDNLLTSGRDYIKETLDYIDRAEELNIWPTFPAKQLTHAYFTIEPYLTTLNAISLLGKPEYLTYKEDRIAKVTRMMSQLSPEETTLIGEYYLLTLYNLGVLNEVIPDLNKYLEDFAGLMKKIDPAPAWFPNGVSYPYAMETLWFFGRSDLITQDMMDRMINTMPEFIDEKDRNNWGHPLSYILNMAGQLNQMDQIFEPSEAYGNQAPILWGVRHFAGDKVGLQKSIPLFNHALISLALRMRGADKKDTPLYQNLEFPGAPRSESREFETPIISETLTRQEVMEKIRSTKLMAGMHNEEYAGYDTPQVVEMARGFAQFDIIPEIGTSPEGLEAIKLYHQLYPDELIAAGEIGEHNVEQAVAAVEAGARVLVALENPLSAEVIRAAHEVNPAVVVIAAASTLEQAETSIRAGADGIKIRPFATSVEQMAASLVLVRQLREKYPQLLIGGSRGIKPGSLEFLFQSGLEFAGLGVLTAKEGRNQLRQAEADPDKRVLLSGISNRALRDLLLAVHDLLMDAENTNLRVNELRGEAAKKIDSLMGYSEISSAVDRSQSLIEFFTQLKTLWIDRFAETFAAVRPQDAEKFLKEYQTLGLTNFEQRSALFKNYFNAGEADFLSGLLVIPMLQIAFAGSIQKNLSVRSEARLAAAAVSNPPVFLLPGATLAEKEEYVRRKFAESPLMRNRPAGGPFVTGVSIDPSRSTRHHFWINLKTAIGQDIDLKFGSYNPDAQRLVIQPIHIKFGDNNRRIPELQAAYPYGHLSADLLLLMLQILQENGAVRIEEPLGIPGSDKFFDKVLGTTFKPYHIAPADQVYAIVGMNQYTPDGEGGVIPVRGLIVDLTKFHFSDDLWGNREAAPPPVQELKSPEAMTNEFRLIHSPWSRLARGTGLGQQPINFDPGQAKAIRNILAELDWKAQDSTYHQFSAHLVSFILEYVEKGLNEAAVKIYIEAIIKALNEEKNPYEFAVATAILMETVAKLGLDPKLLINEKVNVLQTALDRASTIPEKNDGKAGPYERVSAMTALFLASAQLGVKDALLAGDRDPLNEALSALEQIPAAWNRGRAAAMLITALSVLDEEQRLYGGDRDYILETFTAMNKSDDPMPGFTREFFKVFPLLTMLNAISSLKNRDKIQEYLKFQLDRLQQASALMEGLYPIEKILMTQYYLLALYNLGALNDWVPDLRTYLNSFADMVNQHDPSGNWFPAGVAYAYGIETLWMFGRSDLVTPAMRQRMIDGFESNFSNPAFAVNRDNPLSYGFHALAQMGFATDLFVTKPGGQPAIVERINQMASDPAMLQKGIPALDHALISLALRMRGQSRGDTPAFRKVPFANRPAVPARSESRTGIREDRINNEYRVLMNGWTRISTGLGIGMIPVEYNAEMAGHIRNASNFMDAQITEDPYNTFSNRLTQFILDRNNPKLTMSEADLRQRTQELLFARRNIPNALLRSNADAILIESYGKLGISPSYLGEDFVKEVLEDVVLIHPMDNKASGLAKAPSRGNYNQLAAFTQLFAAIDSIGLKERLLEPSRYYSGSYIEHALSLINQIPSPFARGRYAAQLFGVLGALGFENFIFENAEGKNHLKDLMDYLDDEAYRSVDHNLTTTPEYQRAYPKALLLLALSTLGKPEYLNYKTDRFAEMQKLIDALSEEKGDDVAKFLSLYLVSLSNAGRLESDIPDLDRWLEERAPEILQKVDKNTGYVTELFWLTGREDLIPAQTLEAYRNLLDIRNLRGQTMSRLTPYIAAFMLTQFGAQSHEDAKVLFTPSEAFGGEAPFLNFLAEFSRNGNAVANYLPMINHALINYALIMRGSNANAVFSNLRRSESRLAAEPEVTQIPYGNIANVMQGLVREDFKSKGRTSEYLQRIQDRAKTEGRTANLLVFGPGAGRLVLDIQKKFPNIKMTFTNKEAIDVSPQEFSAFTRVQADQGRGDFVSVGEAAAFLNDFQAEMILHDANEPLPFFDGEFDGVLVPGGTFEYIEKQWQFLSEMKRVMNKGGEAWVQVYRFSIENMSNEEFFATISGGEYRFENEISGPFVDDKQSGYLSITNRFPYRSLPPLRLVDTKASINPISGETVFRRVYTPVLAADFKTSLTIDDLIDYAVHEMQPVGLAVKRSESRVLDTEKRLALPSAVLELGADTFAERMIQRLEKLAGEMQVSDSGNYMDPAAVQSMISELKQALSLLQEKRYHLAYAVKADNHGFIEIMKTVAGLVERVMLYGKKEDPLDPALASFMKDLKVPYSIENDLSRLNRSLSVTLDDSQKGVGFVIPGGIQLDVKRGTVLVPIESEGSGTGDPLLESALIAAQTAIALLFAHEASDIRRRDQILKNPAALLQKYDLFNGFENSIVSTDGKGGIRISVTAMREYLSRRAVDISA